MYHLTPFVFILMAEISTKVANKKAIVFIAKEIVVKGFRLDLNANLASKIIDAAPAVMSTRVIPISECLRERYPHRLPCA